MSDDPGPEDGPDAAAGDGPDGVSDEGRDVERVRVRSGRSRRRRREAVRARRWARFRVVTITLFVVAAVLGVGAGLVARDALAVRDALTLADAEVRTARAALTDGDLDGAMDAIARADATVVDVAGRTDSTLWRLAGAVPVVGEPVALTAAIVDVAAQGTALARRALDGGAAGLATGAEVVRGDGRIDLAPLAATSAALDGLALDAFVAARERLDASGTRLAPAELVDARERLLLLSAEAIGALERSRALLAVLPDFLGASGPRRYLVVQQTSAELRGTGGLLGAYTVMTVDDGRVTLSPVGSYEPEAESAAGPAAGPETGPAAEPAAGTGAEPAADVSPAVTDVGGLSGLAERGVPVSEEFRARYAYVGADRTLSNVNVDPDVATSARVLLDLVAAGLGEDLDGVILVDPIGLGAILTALDVTLTIPEELRAGTDAPATIPGASFARFATIDLYDDFGEARSGERTRLVSALGEQAFTALFTRPGETRALARALAAAAAGRHLQVFSEDADEQAVFASLPVGGDLAGALAQDDVDVLAVTANNAVGGKQDVHLAHRIAARITLGAPGVAREDDAGRTVHDTPRAMTMAVTLDNPLTADAFDRYIVGNCLVGRAEWGCFAGTDGDNRTWWSVWLDAAERVTRVEGPEGLIVVGRSTMHGAQVLDPYIEVPAGSSGTVTLASEGTVRLVRRASDGALVGTWSWWRQAKAIPDTLDIVILPPPGWRVADATLAGGASRLTLLGPDAGLAPAGLIVEDGRVRLIGTVGRDTSVTVAFLPR